MRAAAVARGGPVARVLRGAYPQRGGEAGPRRRRCAQSAEHFARAAAPRQERRVALATAQLEAAAAAKNVEADVEARRLRPAVCARGTLLYCVSR